MNDHDRPRFAPHVRLSFDARRDRWVVLAPERMFVPDEIALDILRLCTGERSVSAMVDVLAGEFAAERAQIAADVRALLEDLESRGVVQR